MGLSMVHDSPWSMVKLTFTSWRSFVRERRNAARRSFFAGRRGRGQAGLEGLNGPARIANRGASCRLTSAPRVVWHVVFGSKIKSLPTCWWCFLCFLCTFVLILIYWISNVDIDFAQRCGVTTFTGGSLGTPAAWATGRARCSLFQLPGRWPGISAVGRATVDELHPKPYHPKMAKTVVLGVFHMEDGLKINLVEPPSSGTTSFCWYGFGHSSFGGFEYFGKGGEYIWPGHCWA